MLSKKGMLKCSFDNWSRCQLFLVGQRRGAPPTLAVILMDDAGCGRGFNLPWITSRPISSPLTTQLGNQSSNFVGIHHWIASSQIHQPFSEAVSLFDPSVPTQPNGVHFWCRPDFISIWPEFPLSIKIKSVLTQFLQVQRRNFTRG